LPVAGSILTSAQLTKHPSYLLARTIIQSAVSLYNVTTTTTIIVIINAAATVTTITTGAMTKNMHGKVCLPRYNGGAYKLFHFDKFSGGPVCFYFAAASVGSVFS